MPRACKFQQIFFEIPCSGSLWSLYSGSLCLYSGSLAASILGVSASILDPGSLYSGILGSTMCTQLQTFMFLSFLYLYRFFLEVSAMRPGTPIIKDISMIEDGSFMGILPGGRNPVFSHTHIFLQFSNTFVGFLWRFSFVGKIVRNAQNYQNPSASME